MYLIPISKRKLLLKYIQMLPKKYLALSHNIMKIILSTFKMLKKLQIRILFSSFVFNSATRVLIALYYVL